MAYTDYTFYSTTYGGSAIPTAAYTKYAIKADNKLNYFTAGAIDQSQSYMDIVKICACEIAEELYKFDSVQTDRQGLKTYSNDGESGTYDDVMTEDAVNKRIVNLIYQDLAITGLLYRGCGIAQCKLY